MSTEYSHERSEADDGWRPCPAGELQRLASRMKRQHKRELLACAGVVGAVLLALAAGMYAIGPLATGNHSIDGNSIGGLSCQQVRHMLPQYAKHQLSAAETVRVQNHLADCPACARRLQQIQGASHVSLAPRATHHAHGSPIPQPLRVAALAGQSGASRTKVSGAAGGTRQARHSSE